MVARRAELRERPIEGLEDSGFVVCGDRVMPPSYPDKESIRGTYLDQRRAFVRDRSEHPCQNGSAVTISGVAPYDPLADISTGAGHGSGSGPESPAHTVGLS